MTDQRDRWAALFDAVETRIRQLGMNQALLIARSTLSQPTVQGFMERTAPPNTRNGTLRKLSLGLGRPADWAERILAGESFDDLERLVALEERRKLLSAELALAISDDPDPGATGFVPRPIDELQQDLLSSELEILTLRLDGMATQLQRVAEIRQELAEIRARLDALEARDATPTNVTRLARSRVPESRTLGRATRGDRSDDGPKRSRPSPPAEQEDY